MKSFSAAIVTLILLMIACSVEVAEDVVATDAVTATDVPDAPVPEDVESEAPANVIDGNVTTALDGACVVVAGAGSGVSNTPIVLLPTTIVVVADGEVAVAAGAGLLSAAMRASIVEEPVVGDLVVGVVLIGACGGTGGRAVVGVVLLVLPEPLKSPPSAVPRLCPNCIPSMSIIELLPKRPLLNWLPLQSGTPNQFLVQPGPMLGPAPAVF